HFDAGGSGAAAVWPVQPCSCALAYRPVAGGRSAAFPRLTPRIIPGRVASGAALHGAIGLIHDLIVGIAYDGKPRIGHGLFAGKYALVLFQRELDLVFLAVILGVRAEREVA